MSYAAEKIEILFPSQLKYVIFRHPETGYTAKFKPQDVLSRGVYRRVHGLRVKAILAAFVFEDGTLSVVDPRDFLADGDGIVCIVEKFPDSSTGKAIYGLRKGSHIHTSPYDETGMITPLSKLE